MKISKSYDRYVLGAYSNLLADFGRMAPRLIRECNRDCKRLLSIMEHHGIPFFAEVLVAFGKHFDKCLSNGVLTRSYLNQFGPYKSGSLIPRLFKGLMSDVFHENGQLRHDANETSIAWLRQVFQLVKTLKISCPDSRNYNSVREFFDIESEIQQPSLDWDDVDFDPSSARSLFYRDLVLHGSPEQSGTPPQCDGIVLTTLDRVASHISNTLGEFKPTEWDAQHGPGAVSDNRGNCVDKYAFPSWSDRLERVFPLADFAFANYGIWADSLLDGEDWVSSLSSDEPASRLLCVPKTYAGPRLIASEPTSHQWCQQVIKDFLSSRVQATVLSNAITFRDQSANQKLALLGSLDQSYATIDLSSASDRISPWVIERLFRSNPSLLGALQSCRTLYIEQDICKKQPVLHKLRKFSTMGSACTFPVQTILFTAVAVTSVLCTRQLAPTYRNFVRALKEVHVFGDDIIVPTDSDGLTRNVLTTLGLRVNDSKSFSEGNFRESCGVDAFKGVDVTPVKLNYFPDRSKPESVVSAVDSHNLLLLRGYDMLANWLRQLVVKMRSYPYPEVRHDSGLPGWLTFGEPNNSHLRERWNSCLHRREFLVVSPRKDTTRVQTGRYSSLLQYHNDFAGSPIYSSERIGVLEMKGPLKLRRTWAPCS